MAENIVVEIPEYEPQITADNTDLKMSGFSITRMINGEMVSIELNKQEVFNAYRWQETEFYVVDIEGVLDEMEDDGELRGHAADEIFSDAGMMAVIVSNYERNRDKYDMEWHAAAVDAIKTYIEEAENNGTIPFDIPA